MKLNPDCIRDILISVEEKTSLNDPIRFDPGKIPSTLTQYPDDVILYHVKQCELSGLFGGKTYWFLNGGCMVQYLSPLGHQFLSDIRSDNNWTKTKEIAHTVGSESLSAIKDIATGVISSLVQEATWPIVTSIFSLSAPLVPRNRRSVPVCTLSHSEALPRPGISVLRNQ
ncbi:MAG: DUF2513 domain-containing protein [Pilosibacter sp.]